MICLTSSNYKSTSEISYPQGRNLSLLFFYFFWIVWQFRILRQFDIDKNLTSSLSYFVENFLLTNAKIRPLLAGKSDKSSEIKILTEKSFDKIRHENFPQLRMVISCSWEWFSRHTRVSCSKWELFSVTNPSQDTRGSVALNENDYQVRRHTWVCCKFCRITLVLLQLSEN